MSARSSQSIPEAALGSHGGFLEQALHHLHHPLVLGRGGGSEGPSTGPYTTHDSHVAGPMSNPTSTVSAVSQREDAPSSIFFHYPLCRGNVPPARWAHAAAAVGSVLWVYGGVGNSVLDGESWSWPSIPAFLWAPCDCAATVQCASSKTSTHFMPILQTYARLIPSP